MFKTMASVLTTKRAPQEDIEKINAFLFRKYISNDIRTILAINIFNIYNKVPIAVQYDTVQAFAGGKINYIKYPKNIKDDLANISLVQKYYNLSLERAREYMEFLKPEDFKRIEQEIQELNPKKQVKK